MKKLLLIILIVFSVNVVVVAQDSNQKEGQTKVVKTETAAKVVEKAAKINSAVKSDKSVSATTTIPEEATLMSVSEKIDAFVEGQTITNEEISNKIDKANRRIQDLQNQSSLRWLLRDMVPIVIFAMIGGFIIFAVYIITSSNYRNNVLKYDTLIKCTEKTGVVPDFFQKVERQKSSLVPIGGRVHLVLAILCGIVTIIFTFVAISDYLNDYQHAIAIIGMIIFLIATYFLFKQYNHICENSREKQ
ncbi:MAG: hypothetical protein RR388_00010 [Rikenellaceae bacterium]